MSKPVFSDLFSFSGRRNRKSYVLYWIPYIIVLMVFSGIVTSSDSALLSIIGGVAILVASVSAWAIASQRCRDFGWTGWATLILLIPVIGLFFSIALLFIPGDVGQNRYGPDPLGVSVT